MKDWVQAQVETGAYANSSDYVRDLSRKDQENRNKQAIQKAITEGLESGMSDNLLMKLSTRQSENYRRACNAKDYFFKEGRS